MHTHDHLKLEPYTCYTMYIIHLYLDSLQSPSVDCWLIFKVNLLSTPCCSSQGGAMAGEVACLSSMTQGKVNAGCIHAESNPEINDHRTLHINWGSSVSVHDVHCVLSEGVAVQRREPAGQRDALWGAQTQECTEDHAESCVPLSRYTVQNAPMLHCCEEKRSWCDGTWFSGTEGLQIKGYLQMHWYSGFQCSLSTIRWSRNLGRTDGCLPHWEHLLLSLGFCSSQTRTGAGPHGSGFWERCEQHCQSVGCCFSICLSVELKSFVSPSARRAGDRAPAGPGTGGLDTAAGSDWPHGRREAGAGRSSLLTGGMEECWHSGPWRTPY